MKILKHKNYPTVMYLSIVIVSLVLFFNLQSIIEEKLTNPTPANLTQKEKITAYAVSDNLKEQKINPYYFYNITILILFALISMILIRFIYKTKI